MTKTLSRLTSLMLVLMMLLPAGAAFAEEERVTLTIGVGADPLVTDWEDNYMTHLLEEELGVDLKFVTYAPSEMQEKINVSIAGGGEDLPHLGNVGRQLRSLA